MSIIVRGGASGNLANVDSSGNLYVLTTPGISTSTAAAWTSATLVNTVQNLTSGTVGAPTVLLQLNQTSTLTGGQVTFEGTFDGINWASLPSSSVLNPNTLIVEANPYTFQPNTNYPVLLLSGNYIQIRARLSTIINGSGSVTLYWTIFPYNPSGNAIVVSGGTIIAQVEDGYGNPINSVNQALNVNITNAPVAHGSPTTIEPWFTSDAADGITGAGVTAEAVYIGSQSPTGKLTGLISDASGYLKVNVAAGSSGNAAASVTGLAVPIDADYIGFNSGGNLVGVSSSNPLPITIENSSIAVTGTFWQATQPVSGTVTVQQSTATSLKAQANIYDGSGIAVNSTTEGSPSTTGLNVHVQNSSAIPVTAVITSTNISTNINEFGGSSVSLGQQLTANSIPVILPSATITTLTPPSASAIGTAVASALTSPLPITVENASLAVTGTFWQTTQPVSGTVSVSGSVAISNAALSELSFTNYGSPAQECLNVYVANPITATFTETKIGVTQVTSPWNTLGSSEAAVGDGLPPNATLMGGLNTGLNFIETLEPVTLDGGRNLYVNLAAADIASLSVSDSVAENYLSTIAGTINGTQLQVTNAGNTDGTPSPKNITARDTGSTTTAAANNQNLITGTPTPSSTATFNLSFGFDCVRIQVTGAWTGTLVIEESMDSGTTWAAFNLHQGAYTTSSYTGNFIGAGVIAGNTNIRVRSTTAWTGTATVAVTFSVNPDVVYMGGPIRVADYTTQSNGMTVKAASTAVASTDTSVSVQLNPEQPNLITPLNVSAVVSSLPSNASVNLTQVGGSAVSLGQQTAANSIPVILPSATITTLTPPSAAAIASALANPLPVTAVITSTNISTNINEFGGSSVSLGQQTAANSIPVILPSATITTLTPPTTVTVNALPNGSNTIGKIDILGNAGAIMDVVIGGATAAANALQIGGVYNSSLPTLSTGYGVALQLDAKGQQLVDLNYVLGALHSKTNPLFALPTDGTNAMGAMTTYGSAPSGNALPVNAYVTNTTTSEIADSGGHVFTSNSATQNRSLDVNIVSVLGGTASSSNTLPVTIENAPILQGSPPTVTPWLMTQTPATSGGLSTNVQQAITASAQVKSSAGQVYGWMLSNPNSGTVYVFIYNTTSSPTIGSTTNLIAQIGIPAGLAANWSDNNGLTCSSGIYIAVSTAATSASAPVTGLVTTVFYK